MGVEEKKYHQIEKYLAGELYGKELQDFEIEMQENNLLNNEITLHQEIAESVNEQDVMDFRKQVKDVLKYERLGKKSVIKFSWIHIGIAAAIVFVIFIGTYYYSIDKSPSDQLYQSYYAPYENLVSGRSEESSEEHITLAMMYYDRQEYNKVIENLNRIDTNEKPLLQLYLGISYLNISEVEKAHVIFENIINRNQVFSTEAYWYDALTYLKEGDTQNTIATLEKIIAIDEDSNHAQKAMEIVNELQ